MEFFAPPPFFLLIKIEMDQVNTKREGKQYHQKLFLHFNLKSSESCRYRFKFYITKRFFFLFWSSFHAFNAFSRFLMVVYNFHKKQQKTCFFYSRAFCFFPIWWIIKMPLLGERGKERKLKQKNKCWDEFYG